MTTECAATIFHVNDLESALKYYVDVLGFEIDFRYDTLAGLKHGEVLIHLSGPASHPSVAKRAVGQGHVYIFCDEVDEYFEDVSRKGALLMVPPADRDYGMRDFAVTDADSNILAFGTGIVG